MSITNIWWSSEFCATLQATYFWDLNQLNMSDMLKNIVKNFINPELILGSMELIFFHL